MTTTAMGRPRVGTAPKALISLFLGRTLTASLVTSFRISGRRIRSELGWTPTRPTFRDEVATTVAQVA